MREDEREILDDLARRKEDVSMYDLAKKYAAERQQTLEDAFEELSRLIYFLAGKGLVILKTVRKEDGEETMIRASELVETYLKTYDRLE